MINAYLTEKVTLLIPAPQDDWMEKPAPSERAISARINYENKRVVNPEGEEVVSKVNLLVDFDEDIYYDYGIRVKNIEHTIYSIDRQQDFSARYLIIYLS